MLDALKSNTGAGRKKHRIIGGKQMIRFATIGTNFIVDLFLEAAGQCSRLMHTAVYSRSLSLIHI